MLKLLYTSRTAVFGDGKKFAEGANNDEQFIAVLNGQTRILRAAARINNDHVEHGPFTARLL